MNVLLITFVFPPSGGVGVLRALSLAKYLPESEIRVDVLTARNAPAVGKDTSLNQQIPQSVMVHRCWTLDLPSNWRKSIKKALSGGGMKASRSGPADARTKGNSEQRKPGLLKRLVGDLLLPDPQVGWLPFAFPAARRVIRERQIDVVLITVPPFSTARLVSKLRRRFPALPIVLDFRDEWLASTISLVSFNSNERAQAVAKKEEAAAVRDATAVVLVTEAARREVQGRYPAEAAGKFICIPNGFDKTPPSNGQLAPQFRAGQTVILTYLGSVYGSTDPGTFVAAVLSLPEGVRSRLRIRFIGRIETAALRDDLLRLGDTIELRDFVPQAEALRAIEDTTYLLLITHDHINVSAKFYDYLGGGKPILGAVHPSGDARRLLQETRAGWWADVKDVNAIRQMLIDAVERQATLAEDFRPDLDRVAGYHRRPLARRYAALLRQIAGVPQA